MEKNIELGYLLDFYGEFLTKHQARLLDMHVNEDFSLAEIAEKEGISRQGVHDSLKRAEQRLLELEERMKLLRRAEQTIKGLKIIKEHLNASASYPGQERHKELIGEEIDKLINIWEEVHGV
ncbi:MAG: putative DNA-binding protein [Firmicutes bacterium ADurb.Bin182]|nr:MAG: putative DNA-binding protein [Firmicutes bacterium ADurb.Bin182]